MTYLIYNPLSANNHGEEIKDNALFEIKNCDEITDEIATIDGTKINVEEFKDKLQENDKIIIIGGDGTLNIFANYFKKYNISNDIYLYEGGSGNDFLKDVGKTGVITKLNKYFEKLPVVEVSGDTRYFINNASFGIDGEVCVVADELRAKGKKKVNYTSIAISLLLGKYKRPDATVIIDGVKKEYKNVWLASAINGRYIGGGMKIAPDQDRTSGRLSFVIFYGQTRLTTLFAFPKLTSGKHTKLTKMVDIIEGNQIEVHFTKPTGLQVDGEVYKDVTDYIAYYNKVEKED